MSSEHGKSLSLSFLSFGWLSSFLTPLLRDPTGFGGDREKASEMGKKGGAKGNDDEE